jgi:hypothetical protein
VLGQQSLGFRLQFRAETQVPATATQRRQVVGVPASKIHEQVSDGPGFRLAVGALQGLAEGRRQGISVVAGSPSLQEFELVALLLCQLLGVNGATGPYGVMPVQLLALLMLLAVALLAQTAQIIERPGADALLAQAKPELITVEPQPGRCQLDGLLTARHQFAPARQV